MTTNAESTEAAKKAAIAARSEEMNAREKELNKDKTGKGLREFLGMTRGKGSVEIQYQNWDTDKPETLPVSLAEVLEVLSSRGITNGEEQERELVRRFVLGDNELLYKEASDPVAEFVEAGWPDDVKKSFRLVVKNYAANAGVSIDDAVALIKPGIVAAVAKKAAEVSA